ncbi:MAG: hypothetical protein KY459_02735 [Acidobacteria bacterium]|nr:hypothetical protein [Acidobacteriota bacterium]
MAMEREPEVVRSERVHTEVHDHEHSVSGGVRRVSWGAIFGGVIVALVVQLLLSLLGLGIGMSTINPEHEQDPMAGLGMGAAIWWVVTALISLFAGGWTAGYLAGVPRKISGALHGVVTWGLATLLTLYMVTTAVGAIVGGTISLASQGLQSAAGAIGGDGQQTAQQTPQDQSREQTIDRIRREAEQILRDTENPELQPEALREELDEAQQTVREEAMDAVRNPQRAAQELDQMFDQLQSQARGVISEVDREEMTNVLVRNTGMSEEEARRTVDNWQRQMEQAEQRLEQLPEQVREKTEEYGQRAAETTASAALWSFFALLVGLLAAAFGGSVGAPKHLLHDRDHH